MKQPIVYVLYDSITNSVFDGQIAQPLLSRASQSITIVTFETTNDPVFFTSITSRYPTIHFIFLKKIPYIHYLFLFPVVKKLKKILTTFSYYTLIARGPLAAYISYKAAYATTCSEMIIQARGLLAEEYLFAHAQKRITSIFHIIRSYCLKNVEQASYFKKKYTLFPITIEAVSEALKEYLITTYTADQNSIIIAQNDIPTAYDKNTVEQWRKTIRDRLSLTDKFVYCYNGSIKPWQNPQQTILFFKKELQNNPHAFLLVLTQDVPAFEKILQTLDVEASHYRVIFVPHAEIYNYLAACDVGLLFRDKNIINWISRPTKALEYQAVGLPIIHNNTIHYLEKLKGAQ